MFDSFCMSQRSTVSLIKEKTKVCNGAFSCICSEMIWKHGRKTESSMNQMNQVRNLQAVVLEPHQNWSHICVESTDWLPVCEVRQDLTRSALRLVGHCSCPSLWVRFCCGLVISDVILVIRLTITKVHTRKKKKDCKSSHKINVKVLRTYVVILHNVLQISTL